MVGSNQEFSHAVSIKHYGCVPGVGVGGTIIVLNPGSEKEMFP